MPGNEYGERIHNFFGQEGLSQDQNQSQVVDGSWSSFNNGVAGNQRQTDPSLIANLKSYSTQQSVDPERGRSSSSQHGLNFTQQPMRSEYSRNRLQEHQQLTNGYMQGQAMPNGGNYVGVNVESSRDNLSAKGMSSDFHRVLTRGEMGESPVNYDFLGGQQHINSQIPGMLQPFPRQQMTFNDMQLLKQQVMVKQMQEYQMQQQLQKQQLEARQLNSLNSNAVNGSHASDNQSHPLVNGIPLQDASSNYWQPNNMTGNTNWMHRGISPVVQGSSSGLMINPEHGQENFLAQQFEPSLYGMHVGGPSAPQNAFSSVQMNSLATQHGSANTSSSLSNRPNSFLNHGDVQNSHMLPRSTYQEKLLFSSTSVPGSNDMSNFENFPQDDTREKNRLMQENFAQMEGCPSEKSDMKVPENITASQKSTTLDPTEEKILFGSDDNLWEAFGNSNDMSMTGNIMSSSSDLFDACPSLQSGSWSALMQSAVAETSSDDAGLSCRDQNLCVKPSNALSERVHNDSTRTVVQHVNNNGMLEKSMAKRSQMAGNIFHPSSSVTDGKNEVIEDRFGIWKAASNPSLSVPVEQKNHFAQNQQMQRASYGFGNPVVGNNYSASRERNVQQHLDNNSVEKALDGSQILESYESNNDGKVMVESNATGNSGKENSNDSSRLKFSQQALTHGLKENSQVNACDLSMLPGGKETQSGHISSRPSISRKFQYHPMGNIGVTDEPSRSVDMSNQVKSISSRQTMLELLDKVDQTQEHSLGTNVSGTLEAKIYAEYGGQFGHSQSSASQGFSLQLAPPSQPACSPDNVSFPRSSLQPKNSRSAPWISNQSFPQQSDYQGQFSGIQGEPNMPSGFPCSRGYQQNQVMHVATQQSAANNLVSSSSEFSTLQVKEKDECSDIDQRGHSAQTPFLLNQTTHSDKERSAEEFPILSAPQPPIVSSSPQPSSSSGIMSDPQAGISAPQHQFWNQPSKPRPDILRPYPFPSNNIEGNFTKQEKTNQISSQSGRNMSVSESDMVKQTSDNASMFSKMVQRNLQTYSRSLPSNDLPKNNLDHDKHMAVKRFEDSGVDHQKVGLNGGKQSPVRSDGLVRDGRNHNESSNHMHMPHFGQTVTQNPNKNHSGSNYQQISPQMAPSWYNQYRTFKNGVVQPVNDSAKFTHMKIGEQSSNVGSSVDGTHSVQMSKLINTTDPGYAVHMQQMSCSTPGAETPSSESLPHGATDKLPNVDKPKKRKSSTSELLSWNKEAGQGPQSLKSLSEAEVDWARATNRFAEKVEFETLLEDGAPIRSKKRLIHTTQLMQQLLHPPPARVLSSIASSNYEFVAYKAARAALADACSSISADSSEENNSNLLSERTKNEKISDQYISKAANEFIGRTRKLETDFARLENGTMVADLEVEVDDLEKFAVINRFAKFHPSSSSMDRNTSSHRLNTQRYVSIAPMPRNIPDMIHCLSL
ncbi:unnamed protein product [Cochlearia groenlandica]